MERAPPQVEHVPPEEALAILGGQVAGPDGKTIGRLVDVLVDASGTPQAAVIDVGGFMGVGARKIAVHWSVLHFAPANPKQPITLDLTLDQIKAAPEYPNPPKPAPVVLPVKASGETNGGAPGSGTTGSTATGKGTTGSAPTGGTPTGGGATGSGATGSGTTGSGTTGSGTTGSGTTGSGTTGSGTTGSTASGSATTGSTPTGSAPTGSGTIGSVAPNGAPTGSTAPGSATTGSATTGGEPARQTTPPRPQ
jgi:hypothetical protein